MPDALGQRAGLAGRVPALAPRALAPRHGRGDRARSRALPHVSALRAGHAAPGPSRACSSAGEVAEIAVEGSPAPLARARRAIFRRCARRAGDCAVRGDDVSRAVRFAAVAPRPRRAPVRLRLPHRGLHARARARARLLHAADPPSRAAHRPRRRQDPSRRAPARGPPRALRALVRRGRGVAGGARRRWIETRRSPAWPTAMRLARGVFVGADEVSIRARHAAAAAGAADAMIFARSSGTKSRGPDLRQKGRDARQIASASRVPCAE